MTRVESKNGLLHVKVGASPKLLDRDRRMGVIGSCYPEPEFHLASIDVDEPRTVIS